MSMRDRLDISAYLVLGPENTKGRPVEDIVRAAVDAGFTCIQIRSKVTEAKDMIELCRKAADVIRELGKSEQVTLLVDDRLDVVLAAREAGIKVDGIHVGQNDIPVSVCRKYLGEDAVVGLTPPKVKFLEYLRGADLSQVDYLGVGPYHETATKHNTSYDENGNLIYRTLEDYVETHRICPVPVVVGGGVKLRDLPELKETGVEGFFVVTAITEADDPADMAKQMVEAWKK